MKKLRKCLPAMLAATLLIVGIQPMNFKAEVSTETTNAAATNVSVEEEKQLIRMHHSTPTTGNVEVPVFLVEFPDCKNENSNLNADTVAENLFGEGDTAAYPYESLTNYYERSSYGKLHFSGDVYDWFELSHEKSYYTDSGMILKEVMDAYDDEIDFSQYDSDADGYMDGVYIMYAGSYETRDDVYWSYQTYAPEGTVYDGLKINNYVFQFMENYVATAIHETGHMLGLWDYYDYEGTIFRETEIGGLGCFDMMDHNYGDHNLFSKLLLGWVEPEFVTSDQEVILSAMTSEDAKAVIVTPNEGEGIFSEYYLLELYNNDGNNASSVQCADGAVRIYHVMAEVYETGVDGAYEFTYSNMYPSTSEYKLIKLLESDGSEDNGLNGEPIFAEDYYYAGMTFGINSVPSSDFYEGIYTGINITIDEVSKDEAKITVTFEEEDNEAPEVIGADYWNIANYVGRLANYRLNFNSYIYEGKNFASIICYEKNNTGNKIELLYDISNARIDGIPDAYIKYPDSKSNYNSLIVWSEQELKNNTEYIIEIPAGAVCDAYGNENQLIKETFTTLSNAEYETVVENAFETMPDGVPEGYTYNEYNEYVEAGSVILDDGTILFARVAQNENTEDVTWLIVRRYDQAGNLLHENAVEIIGSKQYNGAMKQLLKLDNGNVAIWTNDTYMIVTPELEVLENTKLKFEKKGNLWKRDRNGCLDIYNDRFNEDKIICRISKADGSCEYIDLNDKNFTFGDVSYYNSDYTQQEDWVFASTPFTNYNYYETFWLNKTSVPGGYKVVYNERNLNPMYFSDSGRLLLDVCRHHTYTIGDGSLLGKTMQSLTALDKEYYKMVDIIYSRMEQKVYFNITDPLSDEHGFITIIGSHGIDKDRQIVSFGSYIIKWDNDYNINWIFYLENHLDGQNIECQYNDGYIVIATNDSIIKIKDKDEVYVSSEKSFDISGYTIDNETMTLTSTETVTINSFMEKLSGEYLDVNFYNSDMQEVTDKNVSLDGGLIEIADTNGMYKWYYKVKEIESINGMHKGEDGAWYYYKDGAVDTSYTGMAKNAYGWWYIKNGKLDQTYTGMAKNKYGWWYMTKGKLDTNYTGMAKNDHGWWYMKKGKLDQNYTGLATNEYGTWYMKKGKLDKTANGMVKVSSGWVYLKDGKFDTTYTGMAKNNYGWWYIKNGELDQTYTGMAKNQYGWWYMTKGKLDTNYTGMAKNKYGWWYMTKGKLDTSFEGIAQNEWGKWYMKSGKLQSNYNGTKTFDGVTYTINKGKVVSEK